MLIEWGFLGFIGPMRKLPRKGSSEKFFKKLLTFFGSPLVCPSRRRHRQAELISDKRTTVLLGVKQSLIQRLACNEARSLKIQFEFYQDR